MKFAHPTIVLDIALLGYAYGSRSGARGVHRVTEYLYKGLRESGKCQLRFVATSHLADAYDFLVSDGISPEATMGFSRFQLCLSRLVRHATRWVHRNISKKHILWRLARRCVSELAGRVVCNESQFPKRILDGADIYHSPLAPIPQVVRTHGKIKHFLTVHDLIPLTFPECLGGDAQPYIRRLLGSIGPDSFAFCVTETVKQDLLHFSDLKPERVFVTPLAADREVFHLENGVYAETIRRRYGIPDAPYFLCVSSFDPRKNFGQVIDCFSRLVSSREIGDINLLIVGSNPERNHFVADAIAKCPEIRKRIITPGFIPDGDLAAIYGGALAFLFPSLAEGFGIPPLEAMQCGTPVITSNAPALPEVVGDAAIQLDPKDADGWCRAMISVANNAELREELKQKGLQRAELFSWDRFNESLFEGYSAALES